MEIGLRPRLRLDVADMKSGSPDHKDGGADGKQDDFGLKNLRPGCGRAKHQQPAVEMMGVAQVLIGLDTRDVLPDHVDEKVRECKNSGGGRLDVEAGKHERHRQLRHRVGGDKQKRKEIQQQSVTRRKNPERGT